MKNFIIASLLTLSLILSQGCATRPPVSSDPAEVALAKQEKIERTSLLLQNVTYSALLIVVEKNPNERTNIVNYTRTGIVAVRLLIDNGNVTPTDLQNALQAIPVKEFKTIEAKLIVPTVVSAYQIWYGDLVTGWSSSDKMLTAKTLLKGILTGAENAIKNL